MVTTDRWGRPRNEPIPDELAALRKKHRRVKANHESKKTAERDREEWTEADIDAIMDDSVMGVKGNVWELSKRLGRTRQAIWNQRTKVMMTAEKEARLEEYEGPVIYTPNGDEDDTATKEFRAALRKAAIKGTCASIRSRRERGLSVGDDDHKFEVMELCAMLGLME